MRCIFISGFDSGIVFAVMAAAGCSMHCLAKTAVSVRQTEARCARSWCIRQLATVLDRCGARSAQALEWVNWMGLIYTGCDQ